VIAKILSNKLKEVLPQLVGESQTAFVKGRQILDAALIANEVVCWLKKAKCSGVLLKLDFEKAYDSIDWGSIDIVLKEMGFGVRWRQWINACITTPCISILFNGKPCRPLKMSRGLRQGGPLSPFLFVLMAEVLNKVLTKVSNVGLFKGLRVGSKNVFISHLQFADDTLLFCEANEVYLQNIKRILVSFQAFSGLAVNYTKSGLVVLGKEGTWAQAMAEYLGCTLINLPVTYLGVPLRADMRRIKS